LAREPRWRSAPGEPWTKEFLMKSFRLANAPDPEARVVLQLLGIALWVALMMYSVPAGVFVGLVWLLPIYICDDIGQKKNRGGFWWGFLLGWLGVAIVACLGRVPTRDELELQRLHQELQVKALQRQLSA
jgi:hypothetical protein